MGDQLILASTSPRRIELLSRITTDFIAVPSMVEEKASGAPRERVLTLARKKACDVAKHQEGIVIGADTLVVLDGDILGKPSSRDQAKTMLKRLSDCEHTVLTGLYVLSTGSEEHQEAVEETAVRFRSLSVAEIEAYLETDEYVDKAGSYAIQGHAGIFVERICGDFFNVMGLPICRLYLLLKGMGHEI